MVYGNPKQWHPRIIIRTNLQNRITAILSDYDGTLCPTDSVRNRDGTIPKELRQVLSDISKMILSVFR